MKNKALKIVLTVVVCVVLTVIAVLALVKIGERVLFFSFYAKSTKEFKVPGVSDGFVQQGFEFVKDEGVYLTSGYMKNEKKASRIYINDAKGKKLGYVELKNADGSNNKTHAGGIAVYGNNVYVATAQKDELNMDLIEVFSLEDVLNKKEAKCIGTINVGLAPAFCYVDSEKGVLYTGNFHKDGTDYNTPFTVDEKKTAIMYAFELDKTAYLGIKDETPDKAYAIPNEVQGMTFTEKGELMLSTSYGLAKSHLLVYDFAKINAQAPKDFNGTPLYLVNGDSQVDDIKAPPMAEELVYVDNRVLIMNESASAKYIFGRFTSGNYIRTYTLH